MYLGDLVRLREYRATDTERALSFINDPELSRLLSTNTPFPATLADEEKWVSSQSSRNERYNFAIETLEEQLYIGGCGINALDWKNRQCTVGIMIGDKNYWGRGYGTDAMRVLVRFLFDQMNMHRAELHVFGYNERAQRSYQKVGFVKEGVLRQCLYRDGAYYDEIIMSMLRPEYEALYRGKDA
jgi:RimJ/RimL family protein N-acetyltransferase